MCARLQTSKKANFALKFKICWYFLPFVSVFDLFKQGIPQTFQCLGDIYKLKKRIQIEKIPITQEDINNESNSNYNKNR